MIYYKPFKCAKFFLQHHFPEMDLSEFTDKFFYAEKYFNVVKFDDLFESDPAYLNFKAFLNGHVNVYPTVFSSMHNLFTLHYMFYDHKIAINFHLEKFLKPFDQRPSEM